MLRRPLEPKLYAEIFAGLDPDDPDRDRFVLSKGHASLAVYAALFLRRWVTEEELNSFCGDGTAFGVHPEALVRGVDFTTGSLGHGLAMGAGAALAARLGKREPSGPVVGRVLAEILRL